MLSKIRNCFFTIIAIAAISSAMTGCGGGGGGGGAAPPPSAPPPAASFISVSKPVDGSVITDVEFRADAFYIEISHTAPLAADSLSVTLKMDNGTPQNITSYFVDTNSTTLRSSGISAFTRSLFVLASNDVARTMVITASAKNSSGVSGSDDISFVVKPDTGGLPGGGTGKAYLAIVDSE